MLLVVLTKPYLPLFIHQGRSLFLLLFQALIIPLQLHHFVRGISGGSSRRVLIR